MRDSVSLFRRIEKAMAAIALGSSALETITDTAALLVEDFGADLGIQGGRIYVQDDGSFELVRIFGEVSEAPIGLRMWRSYPPMEELLEVGSLVLKRDEGLDRRLEEDMGDREVFAAVAVSDAQYVLSFDADSHGGEHEDLLFTLNVIRLAINQKLRQERFPAHKENARRIQQSILPRHLPRPGELEIAARSVAADNVGGDFYDVIVHDETTVAVVVADATGRGLPAALQVRDVCTALRMGLSREIKICRTVERLNRLIHRSRLATRFVSMALAEINCTSGEVFYCNAGHPAPLLLRASGSVERLRSGGMILGPVADTTYTTGVASMQPGDMLVLFSDGISEAAPGEAEEEYGCDRLIAVARRYRHLDPGPVVNKIFRDVGEFLHSGPAADDQTVLVVKRRIPEHEEQPA